MSRQRSINFSKSEKEKLVALVLEKKRILELKKTDAVSSKQKEAAWEVVARQFNASSEENTIRTKKVLKEKYNNIKRMLRKTRANERKEIFMTGGGLPPKKQQENANPIFMELSDVMGVSFDGLPARHDDDQMQPDVESSSVVFAEQFLNIADEKECLNSSFIIAEVCEKMDSTENNAKSPLKWSNYHPAMLREKKNNILISQKVPKVEKESTELVALKKQILEQQLHHGSLEHEQRMMHAAKEHKLRMQILEAELQMKQNV